jgi:hypothetical protein
MIPTGQGAVLAAPGWAGVTVKGAFLGQGACLGRLGVGGWNGAWGGRVTREKDAVLAAAGVGRVQRVKGICLGRFQGGRVQRGKGICLGRFQGGRV